MRRGEKIWVWTDGYKDQFWALFQRWSGQKVDDGDYVGYDLELPAGLHCVALHNCLRYPTNNQSEHRQTAPREKK